MGKGQEVVYCCKNTNYYSLKNSVFFKTKEKKDYIFYLFFSTNIILFSLSHFYFSFFFLVGVILYLRFVWLLILHLLFHLLQKFLQNHFEASVIGKKQIIQYAKVCLRLLFAPHFTLFWSNLWLIIGMSMKWTCFNMNMHLERKIQVCAKALASIEKFCHSGFCWSKDL